MYIKSMKIEGSRVCPYKLPLSTSRSEMHFKMAAGISPRGSVSKCEVEHSPRDPQI